MIIGVGIGGTIDDGHACSPRRRCCATSARAHPDARVAGMEDELLEQASTPSASARRASAARTTCLAVFIEEMPCHIASMPMAVNVQCHAQRHKTVEL